MKGKLSLEKRKDGFIFIVFSVGSYESCFLCAEESGLKIRACPDR